MRVLLIRHSTAVDPYSAPSDDARWLTEAGRSRMERVAQAIGERLKPSRIMTSPLVRAVQTAEILASELSLGRELEVQPNLGVDQGSAHQALALLDEAKADDVVALVTHMPKVAIMARRLAGRDDLPGFSTGSVCCFERDELGQGELQWVLNPETLEFTEQL